MSTQLVVSDGVNQKSLVVPNGVSQFGSGPGCGIRYDHPELPLEALSIESEGRTLLVQNLAGYPVFLGQETLQAGQRAAWAPGVLMHLTENVSAALEVEPTGERIATETEQDEIAKAKKQRQVVQLSVIGLCVVIAIQQLATDAPEAQASVARHRFGTLQENIDTKIETYSANRDVAKADRWLRLLHALQEAHLLELRSSPRAKAMAVVAYERVLEQEPVREAKPEEDTLASHVLQYATRRKMVLSKR